MALLLGHTRSWSFLESTPFLPSLSFKKCPSAPQVPSSKEKKRIAMLHFCSSSLELVFSFLQTKTERGFLFFTLFLCAKGANLQFQKIEKRRKKDDHFLFTRGNCRDLKKMSTLIRSVRGEEWQKKKQERGCQGRELFVNYYYYRQRIMQGGKGKKYHHLAPLLRN